MHNPGPEELEALLPANWIKAQESSSQTIEVEVAVNAHPLIVLSGWI